MLNVYSENPDIIIAQDIFQEINCSMPIEAAVSMLRLNKTCVTYWSLYPTSISPVFRKGSETSPIFLASSIR